MKLTLEEKIARGLVLNVTELMRATGYGRVQIKRMNPPLVEGKIRLSDFWNHVHSLGDFQETPTGVGASPEPSRDRRSHEDTPDAPRNWNDPPSASRLLAESHSHSIG
jgi:hypothetical protein